MNPTPTIHCPYCGVATDYHAQVCTNCGKDISAVSRPTIQQTTEPPAVSSAEDTVKLSTVVLIVVGVVLFFTTFIGGIVCGVAAYFSYRSPNKNWPF